MNVVLYPCGNGYRLEVSGLTSRRDFVRLIREAGQLTSYRHSIIGARPRKSGAFACSYLGTPGQDKILEHANAFASLCGTELQLE